jgi:hypothetical protein
VLDLDFELFRRQNVAIASLVILSALLKSNKVKRDELLKTLTNLYFDPQSLNSYLFEKIADYFKEHDTVPVSVLENWIPEYLFEVWGQSPPNGRSLFGDNLNLREILSFDPTDEQTKRAMELRKIIIGKGRL